MPENRTNRTYFHNCDKLDCDVYNYPVSKTGDDECSNNLASHNLFVSKAESMCIHLILRNRWVKGGLFFKTSETIYVFSQDFQFVPYF